MPVNINSLATQINSKVKSQTLTDLELLQLSVASTAIDNSVSRVSYISDLPDPAKNNGRMVYVVDLCDYRYSDGQSWSSVRTNSVSCVVMTWGNNTCGQLGNNTVTTRSSPVSVVGGFADWCQVSAGHAHTAAVRANGTLWAWGTNSTGQLGDNTATSRSSPVSVVGGFTNWCQVSAGCTHTAAIRTDGTLWAWGLNTCGQLGDNTIIDRSSPVSIVGGFADWCQVSAGGFHTAAIRTNGTLWAWGSNISGLLGDNTITSRSSPVGVAGGFTDWCQVSAGCRHTAAVRTNGSLWSWGSNNSGRLGDNTETSSSSPVSVAGGFTDWCQVAAGYGHTAAVRTNGSLWSWGSNFYGQLGDNTIFNRSSPVSVVGGFTNWCQVSAGRFHTAAIRTNGTLWTWGRNPYGQLGDNTITSRSSPVSIVGGFADWCQVSAGGFHTAAIRLDF